MVHSKVDQRAVQKAVKWAVTRVEKMAVMTVDSMAASRVVKLTDSSGKYSERKMGVMKVPLRAVMMVV